jgi:hypothetical protein
MNINPPVLKFADSVVAKMLPPAGAEANILNLVLITEQFTTKCHPNHG